MPVLTRRLRNRLESTVLAARDVAETAADAALLHLGVAAAKAPPHLTAGQKKLRVRLRARARQLGDTLHKDERQDTDRLVQEVGYEHWHRMLFARFLAENSLLVHENGVPLTLKDCSDLAEHEGASSGWELAGRFASRMLPQVFRPDAPGLALLLAPEHQRELEGLVAGLDAETFQASDSLGWVYQYWQAKKKDEINKSENKIGADELPAVTQLFTEPYMVEFLLHNSLGAWWTVNFPGTPCPVELTYLRTLDDGTPAAGKFESWPKRLVDFKLLDPCCGSGHFLVSAFLMLVPMRMQAEGLSAKEAVDAVLRDNLYGLEIDPRCIEIAAFALALAAWRFPGAGYRPLPPMNLACCGLAIAQKEVEWVKLAGGDERLVNGMKALYRSFRDAPLLGSLLNPTRIAPGDLHTASYAELQPLFAKALQKEEVKADEVLLEAAITAQGLTKAAEILSGTYDLVITNVPYLRRGKQDEKLKAFCEENYQLGKNDLANMFLERCLEFNKEGGVTQVVMPQNWLFLTSYKKQRESLLKEQRWNLIVRLGSGAFDAISGEVVNVILLTLTHSKLEREKFVLSGIDASEAPSASEKTAAVKSNQIVRITQHALLQAPDCRIGLESSLGGPLLERVADALVGIQTSDDPMFVGAFWEVGHVDRRTWELLQSTPDEFVDVAGLTCIVRWEQGRGILHRLATAYPSKGRKAVGRSGVAVHRMGALFVYRYGKERFHQNVAVIVPTDEKHLPAIWCFCRDPAFQGAVRAIDQTLKVTNATLVQVPFNLPHWERIAADLYPDGLPTPYSDDPTQWIFHGHPQPSTASLQVAVARLLGYHWPAELDTKMELSDEARAWIKRSATLDKFADKDGIVCLSPVRGEKSAADRLLDLLITAWGNDWSAAVLPKLLADVDCASKGLDVWLRDKLFEQHVKLFHHRPFIWHIWDGKKDGFSALVNYHRLDHKNLETLTYTYLGDWIRAQERDARNGVDGAEERADAAKELQANLEAILEGDAPYDIFVRWKPLEEQPIGWEPDINDGVRLNIRPFVEADVLRIRPPKLNIKWDKDRGKDVASAPWFKVFNGERINEHHLSLDEKRRAREEAANKRRRA